MVREMGLEPTRLWLDTGTSSLPVYLFQHSRIWVLSGRWDIISWIGRIVKHFFRYASMFSPGMETGGMPQERVWLQPASSISLPFLRVIKVPRAEPTGAPS